MKKVTGTETAQACLRAFRGMRAKNRFVILFRWGMIDGRAKTLEEVGRELHVTRERVRQLEHKALNDMEESIATHLGNKETSRLAEATAHFQELADFIAKDTGNTPSAREMQVASSAISWFLRTFPYVKGSDLVIDE